VLINFNAIIPDAKGKPIEVDGSDSPATLKDFTEQALLAFLPQDTTMSDVEKLKRFRLFVKINGGAFDLTAEEITLAKSSIGRLFGPLVVGRSFELLDPVSA
jgi:hypothetical protein